MTISALGIGMESSPPEEKSNSLHWRSSSNLPYTGIDILLGNKEKIKELKGKRVALLTNQSALTQNFKSSAYALHSLLDSSLAFLFAAEHGWSAFCAAGRDIENAQEPHTKLPIYSLFGSLFEKNLSLLEEVDALIIDVQDVGVRCYTYAATCAKILEHISSKGYALEVILCDRPNPLGQRENGPLLESAYRSLVSYIDVPFQHGKTLGELLKHHNFSLASPVNLSVLSTSSCIHPLQHLWIPPSPGLPDWEAVFLYPGLVLLEGINVSEGRGTSLPFKCIAAPHLDYIGIVTLINSIPDSGIRARPFSFIPQSGKFSGQACQGAQIHILDYQKVDGLLIGVYLLHALSENYPLFEWISSNRGDYWIDRLTGSPRLREALNQRETPQNIIASWKAQ